MPDYYSKLNLAEGKPSALNYTDMKDYINQSAIKILNELSPRGSELYKTDIYFRKSIDSIIAGAEPTTIIEDLVLIIRKQDQELMDLHEKKKIA